MAATVVSAPAQTARTVNVSVPANSIYNFFLYTDAGVSLPVFGGAAIYIQSPNGNLNVRLADLDAAHDYSARIVGPVDVTVVIPVSSTNVGVARFP